MTACVRFRWAKGLRARTRLLTGGFAGLLVAGALLAPAAAADSGRYGAIVVDAATGAVLYEEQADRRHYPASLTKMMTLYMLFDALQRGQLSMSSPLPVSAAAAAQVPSKVWVKAGSSITVEQAIHALAIKSANDVAVVVAEALGGSEAGFGRKMTAMARRLGMWRTTFFNASGLPDERQLSTPRDMAKLSRALLYDFPQHYHYFSTSGFSYGGKRYNSHNRLLASYGGADGIKTGYTRAAGYNISVSAVRQGRRLIAVVFGADSSRKRNRQAAHLLDQTFPRAAPGHPTEQFAQTLAGGKLPALRANLTQTPQPLASTAQVAKVQPAPQPAVARAVAPKPVVAPTPSAPKVVAVPAVVTPAVATPAVATAAAVTPAPTRVGVAKTAQRGPWGIQIGAFSLSQSAHAAARDAQRATQGLAAGEVRVIEVAGSGQASLYRSRVVGLAEGDARAACDFRILHGAPCMVIAPGS
ncbi:MAG: D-alanyl-D-alanine carboxypeptidase family protein [Rhodospirillales bacterium]